VNCNSANNLRNSQAVHEIFICPNSTGGLWGPLGFMQWVPGFYSLRENADYHLVSRLRPRGATPPFLHTPSWRGTRQTLHYLVCYTRTRKGGDSKTKMRLKTQKIAI